MTTAEQARANRQRGQAIARIALAVGLAALGLYILHGFLRALVWAVVLAIATGRLYGRMRARFPADRHDIVLPLVFTIGTTLLFVVPLAMIGIQIAAEARVAAQWIADVRAHGAPPPPWLAHLPVLQEQAMAWWQANLADPEGARALLGRLDRAGTLQMGRELGTALAHRAVLFGFTLLTLFFLFRDGPRLVRKLLFVSRRLFGPEGEPIARQMVASIHGTVDGLVLVGLGIGAALGVGYALAGAPHPALLGAATAIAAVVPMGAPIVLAIASGLVLAAGKTVAAAVLFGLGMTLIFIADHAIRPALIGGTTRLPFLWVLLGILGGVETFGLLGLFLGPAVMAALIMLWREWTGDASGEQLE
ncbi:MAG TPA: AI-2E family transporter [Acetobacteraceae bacterium]|nr:AI-2E family transporter [Acetobacteraceae bacterium]